MSDEPVLFHEPGATWPPLLWGPAFAATGYLVELFTRGPVHTVAWILVGLVLLGAGAVWVYARRRFLVVRLTPKTLSEGRETLDVKRIAKVEGVGAPIGAQVIGGGWSVPKKFDEVPLELDDGTVVLAWAQDGAGLRDALARLVEPDASDPDASDVEG